MRVKETCAPGGRVEDPAWNVRGPLAPPRVQLVDPPDEMVHAFVHVGGVEPALVPANTTWQVAGVQEIGLPPLFLIETEIAVGDALGVAPALSDAWSTTMLELEVALLTRL